MHTTGLDIGTPPYFPTLQSGTGSIEIEIAYVHICASYLFTSFGASSKFDTPFHTQLQHPETHDAVT